MSIVLWGLQGEFSLGLPLRSVGYVLLALYILLLVLALLGSPAFLSQRRAVPGASRRTLLLTLVLLAPLLAEVPILRLPASGVLVTPGVPRETGGPAFSVLGGLPWMLAGGALGPWEAALVGLAGGIVRGGFTTLSLLTPFHAAAQAACTAWLLRRDYAEWPGKAARNPLVSSVAMGLLFGLLGTLEVFAHSGGSTLDGLEFAVSRLTPVMLASTLEAGAAGTLCEALRIVAPYRWYRPRRLVPGPYSRSLAAVMLSSFAALGVVSAAFLLYSDWVLARSAARDLVASQMTQSATLIGSGVPYFVQTGRSAIHDLAAEVAPQAATGNVASDALLGRMRLVPFFGHLVVFNAGGQAIAEVPAESFDPRALADLGPTLAVTLAGIPQETIAAPLPSSQGAQLVFLTPLLAQGSDTPSGALAGWTDLASNPLLQPVVDRLRAVTEGEAFVTDESGTIILHADSRRLMQPSDVGPAPGDQVSSDTAPDGTQRLVYAYPVQGYPWRVVITMPQRVVDALALRIAGRLFAVILVVGMLMMAVVYAGSRRLTRPLRQMAVSAEAIAQGDLARPVSASGEDEIGRLALSFEGMRRGLQSRLGEMDLLLTAGQQMSSSLDPAKVLPPVLEGLRRVAQADSVRLALMLGSGETSGRLEVFPAGADPGNWQSLDRQVVDLCRARGRFALEHPARAKAVLNLESLSQPIQALMAVPMRDERGLVGVIWVGHARPHAFTQDEVNLLSIVAGQLAISVANARLYQRAEQERSRLAAVLEATPDAVIAADRRGRITLANPAAEAVLRGNAEEALGRPATECVTVAEVAELLQAGSQLRSVEVSLEGGRLLFATATDIHPGGKEPTGRVCILWDVTHFKKLDMLKSEFVSTVSHDLRAPLTLMRGYATMLSMVGAMNEKQKEFVRKIYEGVEQMTSLVDNLLDLGRIEAGVGLSLEPVSLEGLVREVAGTYQPQAANKRIALSVEVTPGLRQIEADAALLRQAIANLVDNAIKFTQPGGRVTIRAKQHDERQMVSVVDTGMGISPTDQARLFEKFYRARRSESLKEKGSGLGLAIVKSIAEQHGGRVTVESRLGAGSAFTLEVPARSPRFESTLDSLHS